MSARSTILPVAAEMYCCLSREPSFDSRLKRTVAEDSVAEYSLTGMDTNPKLKVSDAMERAAMERLPTREADDEHTASASRRVPVRSDSERAKDAPAPSSTGRLRLEFQEL